MNGDIKCITFDKKAQDNLSKKVKDKMKENQDKTKKEMFVYIVETSKGVAYSYLSSNYKAKKEVERLQPRFKKPMQINIQRVY